MSAPHDRPTAAEMVEAVREWMSAAMVAGESPSNRFHARVAENMLAIVEREMAVGDQQEIEHRVRLRRLGVADDVELAAAIRSGALDDRADEVRAMVWQSVRAKLAVANPTYLDRSEG
ncbi:MAG: DUF6285 domain-containing protein [Ilumatobacteraceae bacterium]